MSHITLDELDAELRRVAPNAKPPASEGWFDAIKAGRIWNMTRSNALHHIHRMLKSREVEAWPGNRPKCLAYFRFTKKGRK